MPSITPKFIGRHCGFINQNSRKWFVVHFTGGTPNLQSLYNYWLSQCGIGSNSHFGIERTDNQWARAGDIWQFMYESDGACANCCSVAGACAPFLPPGPNYNVHTISVECINPNSGNEGLCTGKQYESLVWLIRDVCRRNNISTTKYTEYTNSKGASFTFADGGGGVIMHRDFDQVNRARCPGMDVYTQQMKQIMQDVNSGGGTSTPQQEEELEYMATQLEERLPVTLIFAGGNRKQWLRVATDHSDANLRLAFHLIGTDRWTIKEINVRPGQNCNDTLVGPGGLNSDYVSVEVTEFNQDTHSTAAAVIPF